MAKKVTKNTHKKSARAVKPVRARDQSWHSRFLDILGSTCNVTLAAKAAGIERKTAYEHYRTLPDFAAAWDDAKQAAVELLEAEAWKRARQISDTLIIFLLKAHKPSMYRERYEVSQTSVNVNWDELTDDELKRIATGESPALVLADRSKQAA